jgi:hypothetical protein
MGGGESTNSSQSVNRPLTAAERQDLYRSSIGNILNTYTESGLPYGGTGSMNASNATFDPTATNSTWGNISQHAGTTTPYSAGGGSSTYDKGGKVTLDPKTWFQAPDPTVSMPTGATDPGGINLPVYQTPTYQAPGAYQKLANGDYDALQTSLLQGNTAGLDYAKANDTKNMNQDLSNRGIWSTGLAEQATKDLDAGYAPQYTKAGADATNARYSLQSADNAGANAYNLNAAQNANNFNVTNANNAYQSGWQPLEYLRNLWNGTSGQTSGSSSFGQGLEFNV